MATSTLLSQLINPEVIGARLALKMVDMIKFAPIARMGYDLQGSAGSTITIPYWEYIGDATVIAEDNEITTATMSQNTMQATIQKIGRGVRLTDEAVLSAYGDPVGEAENQLGMAIAQKIDDDVLTAMATCTMTTSGAFSTDVVANALVNFGEDIDEQTYLMINPTQYATLRKDDDFVHIGNGDVKVTGTVGQIYGCTVVVSNKLAGATVSYLVRQDAVGIEMKRGLNVETERDSAYRRTLITADAHYVAYKRNDNKIVKLLGA